MALLRLLLVAPLALTLSGLPEQRDACETARGLMQSTRSSLPPQPTRAELGDALQNLRRAADLCPGLGDAYYFLSLVADELKDARGPSWLQKAKSFGSEAMRAGEPLHLANLPPAAGVNRPAARGVPAPAVAEVVKVSPFVRRKLALVAGVSRFQDARINALRYTAKDAEAVAAALKKCCEFDYVKTLLDEEATRKNLTSEIDNLAKIAEPDDLVVVYISSHGSPEDLDTAGVNYIIAHDTEASNLYATAYAMDDLLRALGARGRIKAQRVIAFLDTCYSGGTYKELPPGWVSGSRALTAEGTVTTARLEEALAGSRSFVISPADPTKGRIPQGTGRVIITSSSQAERSWEDDKLGHGYFTYFLLKALEKPSPLSIEDVFAYLKTNVPEAVQRERHDGQHPMIARSQERIELYLKDRAATPR